MANGMLRVLSSAGFGDHLRIRESPECDVWEAVRLWISGFCFGQNRWPSAREWLSREATGPVLRCNAGQL